MTDVIWLWFLEDIYKGKDVSSFSTASFWCLEKKDFSPSFCTVALKEDLTRASVLVHFPEDFVESIYGWIEMETGECHGTAYRVGWLDAPTFFRSVMSNAVTLTSLFSHHLGWALINAIEVIFLLAWSGSLTQGTLWKWSRAFPLFHSPSHFVSQSEHSWPSFFTYSKHMEARMSWTIWKGLWHEGLHMEFTTEPSCCSALTNWGHRKADFGYGCLTIKSEIPP